MKANQNMMNTRRKQMEPSDNAGDKVAPTSSFFNGTTILALLIIVAQVLISVGTYPFLPPMVPSHFDASGQVNGYLPKLVNAILLPGISIVLFLVLRFITQIGPNLGHWNQRRANMQVVGLIMVGVLLFNLVIQLLTTAYALGAQVDISLIVFLAVSVLFMFLGNYLGKLRRNFWAGIRTPWTLASSSVLCDQVICADTVCTNCSSGYASANARIYFRFRGEKPRICGKSACRSWESLSITLAPQ